MLRRGIIAAAIALSTYLSSSTYSTAEAQRMLPLKKKITLEDKLESCSRLFHLIPREKTPEMRDALKVSTGVCMEQYYAALKYHDKLEDIYKNAKETTEDISGKLEVFCDSPDKMIRIDDEYFPREDICNFIRMEFFRETALMQARFEHEFKGSDFSRYEEISEVQSGLIDEFKLQKRIISVDYEPVDEQKECEDIK
jgi:hypothetical protein